MVSPLRIAAAQSPVTGDLPRNLRFVGRQLRTASARGAQVVHFPESALCGYGPRHLHDLATFPWDALAASEQQVQRWAAELGLWVVVGSMAERTSGLPCNTSQVIDPSGEVRARYAKQRLTAREAAWYHPGDEPVVVEVHGIRCGLLICYDNGFPELFEAYRQRGVQVLFHSFYNARNTGPTDIQHLMRATMLVRAADHGLHISVSNSSEPFCPLPAGLVRPDGGSLWAPRHRPGVVVGELPVAELGWTFAAARAATRP